MNDYAQLEHLINLRIDGVFDHPALLDWGSLSSATGKDIFNMIAESNLNATDKRSLICKYILLRIQ